MKKRWRKNWRKREEELTDFKKRLNEFRLNEAFTNGLIQRIKRAFDKRRERADVRVVSKQLLHGQWACDWERRLSPNKPSKEEQA